MAAWLRMSTLLAVVAAAGVFVAPPASAGGGCHAPAFTDEPTTEIRATGNCFLPTVARVDVGATVTWKSSDEMPHTVSGVAEAFGDAQPEYELTSENRIFVTFEEPGVYPYVCALHPMMAGAVVVGDGKARGAADVSRTSDRDMAGGKDAAQPGAAVAAVPAVAGVDGGSPAVPLGAAGLLIVLAVAGPRLLRRGRASVRAED